MYPVFEKYDIHDLGQIIYDLAFLTIAIGKSEW